MDNSNSKATMWKNQKFGIVLAILMGASMWFYFQRVLVPYQQADAAVHGRPRGNLSDLYPRWWGAHELLLHGRDPYSSDVTREIQAGYYGRVLDPARGSDPKDEQGFAYPVYVVFLLAPTVHWPFHSVQRGFQILLWLLTALTVPLWLYSLGWRPSRWVTASAVILLLGSLPAVQAIKLQQLSLLVAAFLAASLAAVAGEWFAVAGVLLALSTIKPQLAWLPALWLLLWTLHDWRRRQRLAWAFAATLLALFAGAQVILPGWIGRFYAAVENYHRYTHNVSVLGWLLTPLGGNIAAVILFLLSGWLCWPLLRADQHSAGFKTALVLVFALAVMMIPMFAPYNQVLLLPVVLTLCLAPGRRDHNLSARLLVGIVALLLLWPWIASVALMLGSFVLPPTVVQHFWKLPFLASLLLPIFVFVLTATWAARLRLTSPDSAAPLTGGKAPAEM